MGDNEDLSQALLDMSPSERLDYVSNFIVKSEERLDVIMKFLGWTERCVMKDYNTNSLCTRKWRAYSKRKVPVENFNSESAGDNGYESSSEELTTSTLVNEEPSLPQSYSNGSSLFIPEENLQKIVNDPSARIAERFSDLQINLTREQKLRLYNYVVGMTPDATKSQHTDNAVIAEDDYKTMIRAVTEVVAKRKEEKKQQRKYKVRKLTYIEELRHLLHLQMDAFRAHQQTKQECSAASKGETRTSCDSKGSKSVAANRNAQNKLSEIVRSSRKQPKRLQQRACRKIAKGKPGGGDHSDNVSSDRTLTGSKGDSQNSIKSKVEAVGSSFKSRSSIRRSANLSSDTTKDSKPKRKIFVRARN